MGSSIISELPANSLGYNYPGDVQLLVQGGVTKKAPIIFGSSLPPTPPPFAIASSPTSIYRYTNATISAVSPYPPASYTWDFGDGNPYGQPATGESVSHKFFSKGPFIVTATRTASDGITTASATVTVLNAKTFGGDCASAIESATNGNTNVNLLNGDRTKNMSCWASSHDFSCRGYNGNFTLITQQHAIFAVHFGIPSNCQFVDSSGNIRYGSVAATAVVDGTDIGIATFADPVDSSIIPCRVESPDIYQHYYKNNLEVNVPVCILPSNPGRQARTMMFAGDAVFITSSSQANIFNLFPNSKQIEYDPYSGDSGSPVFFLPSSGRPILITSLYTAVGGYGYSQYLSAIAAITGTLPSIDLTPFATLYP